MAFFSGIVLLALSFFRLGFLFSFISLPALGGIMSGSAVTIVISQVGKMLGIHVSTRDIPYNIFVSTMKNVHHANYDAVFAVLSILWLYGVQYASEFFAKRYPQHARAINYFSVCRKTICLVFTTFLGWVLVHFSDHEINQNTHLQSLALCLLVFSEWLFPTLIPAFSLMLYLLFLVWSSFLLWNNVQSLLAWVKNLVIGVRYIYLSKWTI